MKNTFTRITCQIVDQTWTNSSSFTIGRPSALRNFSGTLARMNATNRRQFIGQCAGVAAGAWLFAEFARAAASSEPSVKFPSAPRERVAGGGGSVPRSLGRLRGGGQEEAKPRCRARATQPMRPHV